MVGTACGDIRGSLYERFNCKRVMSLEELVGSGLRFTDDTVITAAVAHCVMIGLKGVGAGGSDAWLGDPAVRQTVFVSIRSAIQKYGRFLHAGYGGAFRRWLRSVDSQPYNS